jgi:hypothetical protein
MATQFSKDSINLRSELAELKAEIAQLKAGGRLRASVHGNLIVNGTFDTDTSGWASAGNDRQPLSLCLPTNC